jgi:flagellin-like hook-associated protein FlgL
MVIQHNMAAENGKRMHKIVSGKLIGTSEKLSSGYRVNRAADDAAGLSISEKMRFQIRGLDRGSANINEGIGYCQVADGALHEMHDMLQRMNELSIQAANGTNSAADRSYIDDEIQMLKAEIDRICITTKYNQEYVFRCEDKIVSDTWEVYRLKFQGYPDDLYIYNDSYDSVTKTAAYGGVAIGGKRYSWASISPDMYDTATGKFHAGEYSFRTDDGTSLTLVCVEGSEPPQVSRKYFTAADQMGIRVNNELISWDDVWSASGERFDRNNILNEQYSFDYHGVTISFTPDETDDFDAVMTRISGTVWNSTYRMPTEQTAVIADFSGTTMPITDKDQIKEYLANSRNIPKYILHAGDGTSTFDGIWLEETDSSGNGTGTTVTGSQKSWADIGITNWGDQSTDIWSDKVYKYLYDYCTVPGHNGNPNTEEFGFNFQLINETSKDSVIDALDGVVLNCGSVTNSNQPEATFDTNTFVNVISSVLTYTGQLSLKDEYNLGRDFEKEQDVFPPSGAGQLTLDTTAGVTEPIFIKYTNTIDGTPVEKTYAINQTTFTNLVNDLVNKTIAKVDLSSSNNILQIIAERFAKGAANPTEITMAGVVSPSNITGGGSQTYFADTVRIDSNDPNLITTQNLAVTDYACAKIDFSGLGTSYQLADLIGLGFNSTCQTCSNHYSIQFTTQGLTPHGATTTDVWQDVQVGGNTYRYIKDQSGQNHTIYIDVDSLQGSIHNGIEFSNTLVELLDETGFDFHFTQYATNKNDAVFYAFDNRPQYATGGVSSATNATFDPFAHGFKNTLDVNLSLRDTDTTTAGSKLTMNLKYQYNVSNLFAPENLSLTETLDNTDGKYIKDANGNYVAYDPAIHGTTVDRYNVTVNGIDYKGQTQDAYFTEYIKNKVLKDIVDATTISLKSDHYVYGKVQAQENANKAMVTEYNTPYQLISNRFPEKITEKDEYLNIQCSSNTIDYISIQKQRLSIYRMGLYKFQTLTEDQATKGIDMVSNALKMVSAVRSRFGAYQNRLEHAYAINRNTHENTQSAESAIRDTDMAETMVAHSNNSVLQQSANAMLAQANQANRGVLSLLQ